MATIMNEHQNCPADWSEFNQIVRPQIVEISQYLEGREYYPRRSNIFRAFDLTLPSQLKVIMIGQDPYPQLQTRSSRSSGLSSQSEMSRGGEPRAQGLAFSVSRQDTIPHSLRVMFEELERTHPQFTWPSHGNLEKWAQQGILLLNYSLTVSPGEAGSHGDLWRQFLITLIGYLNQLSDSCYTNRKLIYVLLGGKAQSLARYISPQSIIIRVAHPAAREGFIGSNVFDEIDQALIQQGQLPIDWSLD